MEMVDRLKGQENSTLAATLQMLSPWLPYAGNLTSDLSEGCWVTPAVCTESPAGDKRLEKTSGSFSLRIGVSACVGVCIACKVWPSLKSNMSQMSKWCDRTWSVLVIILTYLALTCIKTLHVSFPYFRSTMFCSGTKFKACVDQWNWKKEKKQHAWEEV